jgi:hypothetical protein
LQSSPLPRSAWEGRFFAGEWRAARALPPIHIIPNFTIHCAHGAETRRTRRTAETTTDWNHTEGTEGTEVLPSYSVTSVPSVCDCCFSFCSPRPPREAVLRTLRAHSTRISGIRPSQKRKFARRGNGGNGELILAVLRSLRSLCVSKVFSGFRYQENRSGLGISGRGRAGASADSRRRRGRACPTGGSTRTRGPPRWSPRPPSGSAWPAGWDRSPPARRRGT